MKKIFVGLLGVFIFISGFSQSDKIVNAKDIPFAQLYPNKVFYTNKMRDTVSGETYMDQKKVTWFYLKNKYDYWETYYNNGKIREFGLFKKYIVKAVDNSKRNIGMIKIGIWNYYDENGSLIKVIDFGKGKGDKY